MSKGAPRIFDRLLVRRRRDRVARGGGDSSALMREVSREIIERLSEIRRNFRSALVLGSGPLADGLEALGIETVLADHSPAMLAHAQGVRVAADEEFLPFAPRAFDLIVNPLTLHRVNDLPGALIQIRNCLKPDGLFLGALFGGETVRELRQAFTDAEIEVSGGVSPRISPFADVRDLGQLLQRAGFAMPVTDVDRHTLHYADALELMRDLRAMGEASTLMERSRKPLRRAVLMRAAALYRERHARADGRVSATFEIVYLTGWAPKA